MIDDLKNTKARDKEIAKSLLMFDVSVNNRDKAKTYFKEQGFIAPRTARGTKNKKRKPKDKKVSFHKIRRPSQTRGNNRRARLIQTRTLTPYKKKK